MSRMIDNEEERKCTCIYRRALWFHDDRHRGVTVVTRNGCVTVICMPCDDRGRSVTVVMSVRWASHYM